MLKLDKKESIKRSVFYKGVVEGRNIPFIRKQFVPENTAKRLNLIKSYK